MLKCLHDKYFLALCTLLLFFLSFGPVFAQKDCNCDAALKKDISYAMVTFDQQMAFLHTIDKKLFEEFKEDSGISLGVPIAKEMLNASANFSEFQKNRKTRFEELGWNAEVSHSHQLLNIRTTEIAYKAWSECIRECAKQHGGLHVWIEHENEHLVIISILYQFQRGIQQTTLESEIDGGHVQDAPDGKLFPDGEVITANEYKSITVYRNPNKELMTIRVASPDFPPTVLTSRFRKPKFEAAGFAKVLYKEKKAVKVGEVCNSEETPNNDHVRAKPGDRKSPGDGKWRASETTITVQARGPNRFLRNPERPQCAGISISSANPFKVTWKRNGRGCGHTKLVNGPTLTADRRMAFATVLNWSHSVRFTLCADEYRWEKHDSPPKPINLFYGQPLTFKIPDEASNALLEFTIDGFTNRIQPGESSGNGLLEFVTAVPAGEETLYEYKVVKNED